LNLLNSAAALGEVWVGLNTDEFAERYKRRPVYSLEDRLAIVESLRQVDEVIVNTGGEDSRPAILECRPRFIVHGDDWPYESYLRQLGVDIGFLDSHGIEVVYFPYTDGVSTTQILARAVSVDR
jgi:glycerol-3-phosphate cytidylyltransferase